MLLTVDATDTRRGRLHASLLLPAGPGPLALRFPRWIPGVHAPAGPIENLVELRFAQPDGRPLAWRRDDDDAHRFLVDLPAGATAVQASLGYLCNQATANSVGVDSFTAGCGAVLSFNDLLLYPEDASDESLRVRASVALPAGWRSACAPVGATGARVVVLPELALRELVDSPMIAGPALLSLPLPATGCAPVWVHLLADQRDEAHIEPEALAGLGRLVAEAESLFGGAPYPSYHFLVLQSRGLPRCGLEHLASSLCGLGGGRLRDASDLAGRTGYLMAHEYVHAWCGKHVRPAGMVTGDFHRPQRTGGLWLYEGLDQYLGYVLSARAGLDAGADSLRERLREDAERMGGQGGRAWRSVEDTARASWSLRVPSRSWPELRRSQDYYLEGALFWLEADALIRSGSGGTRSLDDLVRRLLVPRPDQAVRGVDRAAVVAALDAVLPYDWDGLIRRRLEEPAAEPPFAGLALCGWRPVWFGGEPEAEDGDLDLSWSLGFTTSNRVVQSVVGGLPADRARLPAGARLLAVNGREPTPANVQAALIDAMRSGRVVLRCAEGADERNLVLDYRGGPRRLRWERDPSRPDLFQAIARPRLAPPPEDGRAAPEREEMP